MQAIFKIWNWYTFSISFILLLGFVLLKIEYEKNREYELVEKKTELNNQIIDFNTSHGTCYIEFENKRKVLIPQSKNYNYTPSGFSEIALVGDSVIKKCNNDTIYLIQSNNKYFFCIGSSLNLNIKK